jgi:glycosyltransferase involved in cell wall biosynthesis
LIKVCYTGPYSDPSGYGEATRNFIAALDNVGIKTTTQKVKQVSDNCDLGWMEQRCTELENQFDDYSIKIIHLTPDIYKDYMEEGKYHIGHLFWETDRLPRGWAEACNQMDEIWTASNEQAYMMRNSGVTVPIKAFPQPIGKKPVVPRFASDKFTFYSIFQWTPRKNPRALIQAYWEAFEGHDDVLLTIKTFGRNYSDQEKDIVRREIRGIRGRKYTAEKYPPVIISQDIFSRNEIWEYHERGDCFVLPTRGEGWCRPAAEACLSGNPVIITGCTGLSDYMGNQYLFNLPYEMTPLRWNPHIKYYEEGQKWAEVNFDELVQTMQYVYRNRIDAKKRSENAKQFVIDNFSLQCVGEMIKGRLNQIADTIS